MGEFLQEIAELIDMAIQKYMENHTVLSEDLIPGKMQQVEEILEKEQQVEEISDLKKSWITFEKEIEERFKTWMGSLDLLEEQEIESPDVFTQHNEDLNVKTWMGSLDLLGEQERESPDVPIQYNEDLNELRNQLGKIYNTDLWGLKLTQLTGLATVYAIEKDQNRGLQTEACNLLLNLFLALIRERKRVGFAKRGMG